MQIDLESADADLISRYRDGDDDAAAVLYERHHAAAWRLAVSIAGRSHADDLASEAFSRVLAALRNGSGPEVAFRPYLMTVVRNGYANVVRRDHRYVWVEDYSAVEHRAATDNGAGLRSESSLLERAFASLPERWQTVLWHTTIEHDSHTEVGRLLGISPSAVAALSYRAREGLRQSYLAAHLAETADPGCATTRERLPAYSREQLGARASHEVDSHLEECAACALAMAEVRAITSELGSLLAPALLGTAAASAYLPRRRRPRIRRPQLSKASIVGSVAVAAAAVVAGAVIAQTSGSADRAVRPAPAAVVDAPAGGAIDPPAAATSPLKEALAVRPPRAASPVAPGQDPAAPRDASEPRPVPDIPSRGTTPDRTSPPAAPAPEVPAAPEAPPPAATDPATTVDQSLTAGTPLVVDQTGLFDLSVTSPDIATVLSIDITSPGGWNVEGVDPADCTSTAGGSSPTTVVCTFAEGYTGTVTLMLIDHPYGMRYTAALTAENNDDPDPANNSHTEDLPPA